MKKFPFITPPSSASQRQRANSRIEYNIKHGKFPVPTACAKCRREAKTEAHHPDYDKPDEVIFLCRRCHLKAHYYADFLDGIAVTVIPPAARKHTGRFKPGHKTELPRDVRLAAAAKVPAKVRRDMGLKASRARWGEDAKPQRYRLNGISETHWELVDSTTGLVEEFIEKTSDDDNKGDARKRLNALNARDRRRQDSVNPDLGATVEKLPTLGQMRRAQ